MSYGLPESVTFIGVVDSNEEAIEFMNSNRLNEGLIYIKDGLFAAERLSQLDWIEMDSKYTSSSAMSLLNDKERYLKAVASEFNHITLVLVTM